MSLKKLGLAAVLSLAALPALAQQTQTVRIGATPGPHAQILEAVKPIAAKKGLDIKIVEFSDYVVPNTALAGGDIEANSFQNQPYLDNQVAAGWKTFGSCGSSGKSFANMELIVSTSAGSLRY